MILTQRLRDAEAQDIFAQMGSVRGIEPREKLLDEPASSTIPQPEQAPSEEEEDVYAGLEIYEEYQ